MSRAVYSHKELPSEAKKVALNPDNCKLIFTSFLGESCMLLIQNNRLSFMHKIQAETSFVNGIYVGRVQKKATTGNAFFVEFQKKQIGYLQDKDCKEPLLINRSFDGMIKEGDFILVKVTHDGLKTKLPSLTAAYRDFGFDEVSLSSIMHKSLYSCLQEPTEPWKAYYETYIHENDYFEVITDDKKLVPSLKSFFEEYHKPVRFYEDEKFPLSSLYSLNTKCEEALSKKIWMKSGAYLIIEQTESFNVIDINSGKNIKKIDSEDYIYEINEEAAKEIALQLRLRNLSGVILIDFINMKSRENQNRLIEVMKEFVSDDPVRTMVHDITRLGIMEITRTKTGKSLLEQYKS